MIIIINTYKWMCIPPLFFKCKCLQRSTYQLRVFSTERGSVYILATICSLSNQQLFKYPLRQGAKNRPKYPVDQLTISRDWSHSPLLPNFLLLTFWQYKLTTIPVATAFLTSQQIFANVCWSTTDQLLAKVPQSWQLSVEHIFSIFIIAYPHIVKVALQRLHSNKYKVLTAGAVFLHRVKMF